MPTDDHLAALVCLLGTDVLVQTERCRRRITQSELARRARVGQSTVSRIEAGEVVPSLGTLVALLAALDLQPVITAVARWSDVDSAADGLAHLRLEDRCDETEELLLTDLAAAADAGLPLALCGAWAARLLGLPVHPRGFELVTSTYPDDVEQVLRWAAKQLMHTLHPRTRLPVPGLPTAVTMLEARHLHADWGGFDTRISCEPRYRSLAVRRVRLFDVDVPVLSLEALTSTDPWVRRVLTAAGAAEPRASAAS